MPGVATTVWRRGRSRIVLITVVGLALVSGCGSTASDAPGVGALPADGPLAQRLAKEVGESGAFVHLQQLQRIADQHGGNRAGISPGYEASVDYVAGVLRNAGFDVSTPTYRVSSGEDGAGGPAVGRNVVAQTRTGDPGKVVMLGAHLDSVPDGPGIVDNGSGVATLLEIATRLGASPPVGNVVRFAFFGSEEDDLQGSRGYVESLSADDRGGLLLYLNVDMVASPNAGYFVQGGEGSATSKSGPPGSAAVARILAGQLAKAGVIAETAEFGGDDEAPFVEAGTPSAGAENGDRERKTESQAAAWGGQPGEPYDRCYHQACDRLDNVNRVVLDHYLHAIAGTVAYFATTNETPSN